MSFILKQSDSYTWPITLVLPVDGGRREKHTFDGEFKRLPQSRINEIIKLARRIDTGLEIDEDGELEDQAAAKEILIGWSGVVDDDGKDVPFSDKSVSTLLELPTVAGQIVRTWFESLEVAKKKNN